VSTITFTPHPIAKALIQAEAYAAGGYPLLWQANSVARSRFVSGFLSNAARAELTTCFKPEELRAWANGDHVPLNTILEQEKFSIRFDPFQPGQFGSLSILDVLPMWLMEAQKTQIFAADGKFYPGVSMKRVEWGKEAGRLEMFRVLRNANHSEPIIVVNTQNGDSVFMTIAADVPCTGDEAAIRLGSFLRTLSDGDISRGYDSVQFPMLDIDQQPDISWLQGLWARCPSGDPLLLARALQQMKFKMNHLGCHLRSAAALSLERGCVSQSLDIDRPFFLWIMRPGVSHPLLAAYVDYDVWKDPGTLDM
jgi:hypothetical protein